METDANAGDEKDAIAPTMAERVSKDDTDMGLLSGCK
jgi:hypothetical protein